MGQGNDKMVVTKRLQKGPINWHTGLSASGGALFLGCPLEHVGGGCPCNRALFVTHTHYRSQSILKLEPKPSGEIKE